MSQLALNPYINFQGQAREAMEFYHQIFGGSLTLLADNPDGPPKEAGPGDRIMHSYLEADGLMVMATDGLAAYPPTAGDNIALAVSGTDTERLIATFTALGDGGMIKQALKTEVWGDTFGYLVDKFGINWMFNITKAEAEQH